MLGTQRIPCSNGQCGPDNGPQCSDCRETQQRLLEAAERQAEREELEQQQDLTEELRKARQEIEEAKAKAQRAAAAAAQRAQVEKAKSALELRQRESAQVLLLEEQLATLQAELQVERAARAAQFELLSPNAYGTSFTAPVLSRAGPIVSPLHIPILPPGIPGMTMFQQPFSFTEPHFEDKEPSDFTDHEFGQAQHDPEDQSSLDSKRGHAVVEIPLLPDDCRTGLMLKNLPASYTRRHVEGLLEAEELLEYCDFLYVPMDHRRRISPGYAFVNVSSSAHVQLLVTRLRGFKTWTVGSSKVLEVCWSQTQGLDAFVARYRNSRVMHHRVPEEFQPVQLQHGVLSPLPGPTKRIRAPFSGSRNGPPRSK